MTRTNIIILVSVLGVGILAYIIYTQAIKRKKQVEDTERLFKESLTPAPAPAPAPMPAPSTEPFQYYGGGVLAPEYNPNYTNTQSTGLGFMPGTTLTNLN